MIKGESIKPPKCSRSKVADMDTEKLLRLILMGGRGCRINPLGIFRGVQGHNLGETTPLKPMHVNTEIWQYLTMQKNPSLLFH